MRVAFYTLGCKVNQYETQAVAEEFVRRGYVVVDETEEADVYVVNSCSVTRTADSKSRNYLRRMKRRNPGAVAVLMGCYPQVSPAETSGLAEADIILGTENKMSVPDLVQSFLEEHSRIDRFSGEDVKIGPSGCAVLESRYQDLGTVQSMLGSRRALIKVQDGCNRFCSYCIIPHARGNIRSRSPKSIEKEARALVASGCREIVLTGINTALYGAEPGFVNDMDWSAEELESIKGIEIVVRLLNDIPGDFRVRLSSLEPTVVDSNYLTGLLKYGKLAHHAHLSAQSGSDRVIASMNRHYTVGDYLEMVRILREFDPLYGVTTDIIVGFPGETEEEFEESLELVGKADFLKVHGFPYSDRPGTKATAMSAKLGNAAKKDRNARLAAVADEESLRFREAMIGTVQRVLPEEPVKADKYDVQISGQEVLWRGHASNYTEVYFTAPAEKDMTADFVDVIIEKILEDGVLGVIAREDQPLPDRKETQMFDCIFCKIAAGDIPSNKAYEDDRILAFYDLDPQAPVHVLIIPKKHIDSLGAAADEDEELLGYILIKARDIAAQLGLENGFRVVINTGEDGGQTVRHLHVHLLGKRSMTWPPG